MLERIREIRASERRYYQKITDIYAECSADYDPKSETTQQFFKMVQNMMHWAVTHQLLQKLSIPEPMQKCLIWDLLHGRMFPIEEFRNRIPLLCRIR